VYDLVGQVSGGGVEGTAVGEDGELCGEGEEIGVEEGEAGEGEEDIPGYLAQFQWPT
jgi:hypothetical protein